MYYGFNCMFILSVSDGRTSVDTAKPTHENQINDVEDTCRDSNHFEPILCGFELMFLSTVLQAIVLFIYFNIFIKWILFVFTSWSCEGSYEAKPKSEILKV